MPNKGMSDWVVLLIFVVIILVATGAIKLGKEAVIAPSVGPGYATTLSVSAINAITGAPITDANGWVYANDGTWTIKDVSVNSAVTSLSTSAPNSLDGYLIIGNDQNQGTDRGTEWYYRKIPFRYINQGAFVIPDVDRTATIKLYAETTSLTLTGYDDGTAETILNVTVGTSVVSSTELKVEVAADTCFGNPDFNRPVGVCFNASDLSKFNDIRPTNYAGTFATPEVLKGKNIIGCYILPTEALCDDGVHSTFYRFYVTIDPALNPGTSDYSCPFWMDRTRSLDDAQVWQDGWGDNSVSGTDYDPGYITTGSEKCIYFT